MDDTQDVTQGDAQGDTQDNNLDKWIEKQIRQNPQITTEELAKMSNKGIATIKRHLAKMPYIRYVGRIFHDLVDMLVDVANLATDGINGITQFILGQQLWS